tara:strand:- start:2130 stop:2315 length:186 start_codon:yes stop_codon:yes gene_type:complete
MASGLKIKSGKRDEFIAGHMTPDNKKMLFDHYKSIKDPKDKKREAVRLNKMYNKYGLHFGA